jgi:vWA-MoxR associated protein C-terminal domain/vWA-MoxR associated protein middle region (VMAP-M) 1
MASQNKRNIGKRLRIERIESEISQLKEDHSATEEAWQCELDPATKNRLNKKLESIEDATDKLNGELRRLQQELAQLENVSDGLKILLQEFNQHFNDMKNAFYVVAKKKTYKPLKELQRPEDIAIELSRIAQGESLYGAIDEFVAHLIDITQDTQFISALQVWGNQKLGEAQWEALLENVRQQQNAQRVQRQPAVLVLISRSDEGSTQSQSEKYYRIKVWAIYDIQRYRDYQQGFGSIDGMSDTEEEAYFEPELPEKLPILISKYLAEISNHCDEEAEIHVWLPLELINHDVDRWELNDSFRRVKKQLGRENRVIFRCAERLSRSYRPASKWRKKWQQIQCLLDQKASAAFIAGNDADLDNLSDILEDAEDVKDMIIGGVKIQQAPTCVGADSLFGLLLDKGIPLAIWGRNNLNLNTNEAQLDRVLEACCLNQLPHAVKDERRNARRHAEDNHIGHHLSLLWDDPYLLPPKFA